MTLYFLKIQPLAALYCACIINGLVSLPFLLVLWKIGKRTGSRLSNSLILASILILSLAILALFLIK